jgi:hypothetical protein
MGTGSLTVGCHDSSLPMHMASLVLVFLLSGCGLSHVALLSRPWLAVRLRGQSQGTIARDHHDCAQMAARAKDRLPVATDPIMRAAANAVLGAAAGRGDVLNEPPHTSRGGGHCG